MNIPASRLPMLLRAFTDNPVVVRDLRAQMRGTKSYWYQGAYLLLLGLVAVAGYAMATQQGLTAGSGRTVNIVEAQSNLEGFYYFIFMTLAALIALIAPAITASSIVGERQRLSLDLLVTTPLTAAELLIGKLLSSVAFLGLLLALSLPASALCVLLGGATVGDVLRIYGLLAVDGVVLAGIGLFFSSAVRVPLLAVVWTYATVAVYLLATWGLFAIGNPQMVYLSEHPSPLLAVAALNPFLAVLPAAQQAFPLGPVSVPAWLPGVAAAALLLRLLLTAATYRFGTYGGSSARSLRRQALGLSVGAVFVIVYSLATMSGTPEPNPIPLEAMILVGAGLFLPAIPFLPGLFTPATAEDAPPGAAQEQLPRDGALYRWGRVFQPRHGGALPYFHLWLGLTMAAVVAGMMLGGLTFDAGSWEGVALGVLYASGLGFLFWGLARLGARLAKRLPSARALAFGLFAAVAGLPMLVLALTNGRWQDYWFSWAWIFRPFVLTDHTYDEPYSPFVASVLFAAVLCYAGGLLAHKLSRAGSAAASRPTEV